MIAGKSSGKTQLPEKTNFTFTKGDDFEYELEVWTTNATSGLEEAVDLSSATVVGHVKDSSGNVVMPVSTSYSSNLLTVTFDQSLSKDLPPGRYTYDLAIYYNSKYTTILSGEINLLKEVTYFNTIPQKLYYTIKNFITIIWTEGLKKSYRNVFQNIVTTTYTEGLFKTVFSTFKSNVIIQEWLKKTIESKIRSIITIGASLTYNPYMDIRNRITVTITYASRTSR